MVTMDTAAETETLKGNRKPCPFCGQDSGRLFTANDGGTWIECTTLECGAEGPIGGLDAWNKRPIDEKVNVQTW